MKRVNVKVILTAALALLFIPSVTAMGAGTMKPDAAELQLNYISPYRNYYSPSGFEYIDTLTAVPIFVMADVTVGSDGGYGFSIFRRSDYLAFQDRVGLELYLNYTSKHSPSPYGLAWDVLNEHIVFVYTGVDFIDQTNDLLFQAYLYTQDGEIHYFSSCVGTGCSWRGNYWEVYNSADPYPFPDMYARHELYFSDNNWRLEALAKGIEEEGPFRHVEATLFLPDGTRKTYENTWDSFHWGYNYSGRDLALTEVDYPNGSHVTIEYSNSVSTYGHWGKPVKVTMTGKTGVYTVDFIYSDMTTQIADWSAADSRYRTDRPAGKLERLDVRRGEEYLYSRHYHYHEVPEEFYRSHVTNGYTCEFYGPNDYQLVDSFIITGNTAPIELDDLSDALDSQDVTDFWHFESHTFLGIGDTGLCTCDIDPGADPERVNCARQAEKPFYYTLTCPGDYISHIITPWGTDIFYSYTAIDYNPQVDHGETPWMWNEDEDGPWERTPPLDLWYSLSTRVETDKNYGSRRDVFSAMTKVESGDQAGTLQTTIEIDKFIGPHMYRCFGQYDPSGGTDISSHFYSLKKEYYYYDTSSITENGTVWRLYLPKALHLSGVRDDESSFSLGDVEYGWTGLPSPFLLGLRKFGGVTFQPFYTPYNRYENGISQTFIDPIPTVPAISSVEMTRDGLTYLMEASDFNMYNSPGKVESSMGGYARTSEYAFDHEAQVNGDTYMIGVTTNVDTSLNGGSGNVGAYRTNMTNGLLEASVVDMSALSLEYDDGGNVTNAAGDGGVQNTYTNYIMGRPQNVSLYNGALTGTMEYNGLGQATKVEVPNAGGSLLTYNYVYDNFGRLTSIDRPGSLWDTEISYLGGTSTTDGPDGGNDLNLYYVTNKRKSVTGNRESVEYLDGWGRVWKTETLYEGATYIKSVLKRDVCGVPRLSWSPLTTDFTDEQFVETSATASALDAFGRPAFSTDQTGGSEKFGRYVTYDYGSVGSGLEVEITVGCKGESDFCTAAAYTTTYKETYQGPSPGELYMTKRVGPIVDGSTATPREFQYTYGSKGELLSISEESSAGIGDREFKYDAKGNVIGTYSPESGRRRFTRDNRGRITKIRASDNSVVNMEYDDADRVTRILAVGPAQPDYHFYYDQGSGSLTGEDGNWAVEGVSYDTDYYYNALAPLLDKVSVAYGFPTSSGYSTAGFDIKYVYNGYGEVTWIDYDGEMSISLTRDNLGRVTSISKQGADDIMESIEYQPDGSLKRLTYGNDVVTDIFQFYGLGVITEISIRTKAEAVNRDNIKTDIVTIGGGGYASYWYERYGHYNGNDYCFDNYLNPLKAKIGPYGVNNKFQISATYDEEQRLSEAQYFPGSTLSSPFLRVTYDFDRRGNRTSKNLTWDPGSSESYSYNYDSLNRLSSVTGTEGPTIGDYVHDSRGNVIQTPTHKYGFDLFDRLVDADDGKVKIFYTAGGAKFLKVTEEEVTAYFYDPGGSMLCEKTFRHSDFRLISRKLYVYANGQMVAQF